MGEHLTADGEFKSDKYAWCPPGFVALKLTDKDAQPFLWGYAQTHRTRDSSFTDDLETALRNKGYEVTNGEEEIRFQEQIWRVWGNLFSKRLEWLIAREAVISPEAIMATADRLTDLYIDLSIAKSRAFQAKIDALRRALGRKP